MILKEQYAQKYNDGKLTYSGNPLEKEEKDYLDRVQAVYGRYAADCMGVRFGGVSKGGIPYAALRLYGRSNQPVEQYKDQLDPKNVEDGRSYRKHNISWMLPRPLSTPLNKLKAALTGLRLTATTEANDPEAKHQKEQIVGKMKFMASPDTQKFVQSTGYKVPDMKEVEGFAGPEDVDFLQAIGGIQLSTEVMMKDGIDITMHESRWKSATPLLAEDLLCLNAISYHTYTDMSTGRVMVEYIDPDGIIVEPSIFPDHRDVGTIGFIRTSRISEIRQRLGGMSKTMEDRIRKACKNYTGLYGNDRMSHGSRSKNFNINDPLADVNNMMVDVMTLYFIDTEPRRYIKRVNKNHGNRVYDEVQVTSRTRSAEVEDISIHKLYKVNWVVGSDIVFDYGEAEDMVREGNPGNKRIIPNIYFYQGEEPSIVEQCMGAVDDICIATFKRRQAIKELPPGPRMMIDLSALEESTMLGGKPYDITAALKDYAVDGKLIIQTKGEYHMPGVDSEGGKRPITFIEAGVFEDINIFTNQIAVGMGDIQYITGFNSTTAGEASDPEMLKHVAEAAIRSTQAANAPLVDVWVSAHERLFQTVAHKWQLRLLHGDVTYDNLPTSAGTLKNARLAKELAFYDWNIFVKVDDTATKDMLMQDLMTKRDLIPSEVYYIVLSCIQQGDYKKAQVIISRQADSAKKLAHQQQMEIQTAVANGNKEAAIAGEEAKKSTIMAQNQGKLLEIEAQKKADLEVIREKHMLERTLPTSTV